MCFEKMGKTENQGGLDFNAAQNDFEIFCTSLLLTVHFP